jgi:hypothetical protein
MTKPAVPAAQVVLDRDDAVELAEGIGALGSWLYQAPEAVRCDFVRHVFPDPTAPGANTGEFLDALHHAWRQLCAALQPEHPGNQST